MVRGVELCPLSMHRTVHLVLLAAVLCCRHAPPPAWFCNDMSMGLFLLVGDVYILGCAPVCLLNSPHAPPIGDLQTFAPWPILTPCSTGHRP
jgi:hypothetical protein